MIITCLASGSSGNCTLLSTDKENILIDCGITAKKIEEELEQLGRSVKNIDGILLTHEHNDHIKGLKRLISIYHIPVYCTAGTWNSLSYVTKDEYFRFAGKESFIPVSADIDFYIGDVLIHPFHTYHDTPGPLGYRFEMEEQTHGKDINLAVVTDCGIYDDYICHNLRDLDALIIESNHDVDMLMNGPYPMFLKRRILSKTGHASNVSCGETICRIWTPRLKDVILAHLSDENNTPETALDCVRGIVNRPFTEICVAPKDRISKVICF